VQRAQQPARRLRHVDHVGREREAVEAQAADVRLEQHVHLGGWLVDALLDRDGHALDELEQLDLLLLAHRHVRKLLGEREQPEDLGGREREAARARERGTAKVRGSERAIPGEREQERARARARATESARWACAQTRTPRSRSPRRRAAHLDVGERGLEVLVVERDGVVRHVVVCGHAAEVGRLQRARLAHVPHEAGALEHGRGRVDEVEAWAVEQLVARGLRRRDAVQRRVLEHPDEEIRIAEPVGAVARRRARAEDDLGVQVVGEAADELRLDGELLVEEREVVLQLRVRREHDPLALGVVLRPAGAADHLHHVERRELGPLALLRVVDLRALDDDRVRGQVDAPRQRRRRDQHLDVPVVEELFDALAVGADHPGVVDPKPVREELGELGVAAEAGLVEEDLAAGRVVGQEAAERALVQSQVAHRARGLGGLLARVHKD
jgi:hypothetical protein